MKVLYLPSATLLSWAAEKGHETVVRLLIEKGAVVDSVATKYGRTPLSRAAANEHEAVVKLLLERGAAVDSVEKSGKTPLLRAARSGHEAVMKLLLEKGTVVDLMDIKLAWHRYHELHGTDISQW